MEITQALLDRYPSVEHLRRRARRRLPHFAWVYADSGTGIEDGVRRNREAFSRIRLTPKLLRANIEPDLTTTLFGVEYEAPFGIAPVGLTGLMWPDAAITAGSTGLNSPPM